MMTTARPIEYAGETLMESSRSRPERSTADQKAFLPFSDPAGGNWIREGTQNSRWFHEHQKELVSFRGRWVAIANEKVVSTASSAENLHQYLTQAKIRHAFIAYVPEDDRWKYLIA